MMFHILCTLVKVKSMGTSRPREFYFTSTIFNYKIKYQKNHPLLTFILEKEKSLERKITIQGRG